MKQRKCFEIHSLQQPHDIYPSNLSKSTMNQQSLSSACQRLKGHDETLTLLNLSCQGVGSEGVIKLSQSCGCTENKMIVAFPKNDSPGNNLSPSHSPLVALWLEGNDIYPVGARALRHLLLVSPRLKYLYVSHNSMGNSGISALAPVALAQCTVCHVSDNKIGAIGAVSTAQALQDERCQVRTLQLDKNRLGDEGMVAIANALRYNTSLKHLDVRYNKIGNKGLVAIRDILLREENTTLEYFLFEEEEEGQPVFVTTTCTRRIPTRRNRKMPRLMEKLTCSCEKCQLRHEIDFLLALNRAGRAEFGDVCIQSSLWPRILSKVSRDDPSLLFAMLEKRPDVPLRR
jgi:Leucine Rich repeat